MSMRQTHIEVRSEFQREGERELVREWIVIEVIRIRRKEEEMNR